MLYRYRSPAGTFVIAPQHGGCYELYFHDRVLGSHPTPEQAAEHAFEHLASPPVRTGQFLPEPMDLAKWEQWSLSH
ncbi:MAG: hypothetical protein C0617_12510 [Desulfuromonas sp.]|uniref:hypothetical protein n=1 Tax=Desulfuromonas sp. TaxID=892 RepID=UPI000CBDE3D9|nr:hypothetical protein [Desulfuromonas sp.]PLX83342.1 MAG: hypothetical protein C0617_12510 [Desulfuromonas sp.]